MISCQRPLSAAAARIAARRSLRESQRRCAPNGATSVSRVSFTRHPVRAGRASDSSSSARTSARPWIAMRTDHLGPEMVGAERISPLRPAELLERNAVPHGCRVNETRERRRWRRMAAHLR